ncbi:hypothetical protein HHI36_001030 [Cryptolaemus montrouzieri]|uniref:tRNA pseudouridine(55) synthase n=1 Tax=Cryptolaemus montrouzieri TaxID=559131 RepID=A0ABD2P6P4_9CUCU
MSAEEVYLELKNIGCCYRCCLRLLGEKFANYEDPEQSLKELIPSAEEIKIKKARRNPCVICLGVLESNFLDDILNHSCWKELQEFDSNTYKINLNSPTNVILRDKAVNFYIKKKFPDFYKAHDLDESVLPIHSAFKLAFRMCLDQNCGKRYDVHSGVQLWLTIAHCNSEEEVKVIHELDVTACKKHKNMRGKSFGKKTINNILSTISEEKFWKHVKVPPEIPSFPVQISSITIEGLPIFIGGRYCKYSRLLSQTPWNNENTNGDGIVDELESKRTQNRVITSCVQDIIFDGLHRTFGFDKERMTFSASGREDTDVRCLGSGRPFFVKIENVKGKVKTELFRALEETINQSTDVSVFDMQQVDKTALKEIKCGEELKRKTYIALCLIKDPMKYAGEVVPKINEVDCKNLIIQQKTPTRVIHRRTLSTRPKQIFYMKAIEIPEYRDLFQLTVITQAGTYVKEFIHGDFGHTYPCLGNLINTDVDIFRLDVIGIDLNWPKHINSVQHSEMKDEYCLDTSTTIEQKHDEVLDLEKKENIDHVS